MLDYPNYKDSTLQKDRVRQREDVGYAKGHLHYSNSNPTLMTSDILGFLFLRIWFSVDLSHSLHLSDRQKRK